MLRVVGVGAELPLLRPIELTSVPDAVPDLGAVLVALDNAVHACTLLANQQDVVKDSHCLRVALIVNLFTQVWTGKPWARGKHCGKRLKEGAALGEQWAGGDDCCLLCFLLSEAGPVCNSCPHGILILIFINIAPSPCVLPT